MTSPSDGDPRPGTVPELVHTLSLRDSGADALLDRSGTTTPRRGLAAAVAVVQATLQSEGVNRRDRVALVCPAGPEAAAALLGTMGQAVAAPLNPGAPASALRDDLQRLQVSLVLSTTEPSADLLTATSDLGIRLRTLPSLLSSAAARGGSILQLPPAEPSDTALLLQTSGTTSRPKLVPLAHANLLSSAAHVADVLELRFQDRCLGVMPLFHIHGIVTCLLAPLLAGGNVICTGPLTGSEMVSILREQQPSWLSAVPTMLQGLLHACEVGSCPTPPHNLRLIRSSSASLAPALASQLEAVFKVPVLEAYGMTEAAHQICSNRLPPARRRAGTVGAAAGPDVAILDPHHRPCPAEDVGEVAIRGDNVTTGYLETGSDGWVLGPDGSRWFLTGDEGWLAADGTLTLTGRLKEMINRGGEKVIPRQVDEALLEHPTVRQAVCFAVPHPSLGEDLGAAVVLQEPSSATEDTLRRHCFGLLAGHQVPSRILVLDDLPKGPTGKLQRIGLADRLAPLLTPSEEPLVGEVEELVGEIFASVLAIPLPSREGNFFALGGDSLTGQQVISRLNSQLPLNLPATLLFRFPTPRLLAADLDTRIDLALSQPQQNS